MPSRHLQTIIRILVLLVFILILMRMVDVKLLPEIIRSVRLEILLLAAGLYFGVIAMRAYRLQQILNKDRRLLGFTDAYRLTLVGIALNILIPATLGDFARAYYGYKIYGFKEEMLSMAFVDKIFALASLFLLGMVSGYVLKYELLATMALLCTLVSIMPLAFPRCIPWNLVNVGLRLVKKSLDLEKLQAAGTLPARLKVGLMLLSLGGWLSTDLFFYVLCAAFPVTVSLWYIILIMPMLTIARLFPFTVNALGPVEVAVAYFFGLIGIKPTVAVLISLSSNVLTTILPGSIGCIMLFVLGQRNKQPPKKKELLSSKGES